MGKVIVDITISLDGFVTGPNDGPGNGLGDEGMALHNWVVGEGSSDADVAVLDRAMERTGAVLMGRNTFDVVDGPHGWSEDFAFSAQRTGVEQPPNVVLTHSAPDSVRLEGAFEFVTEGVEEAVRVAKETAGEKDVTVMGGGRACQAVLQAGLADELILHVAPLLLGAETRLIDDGGEAKPIALERLESIETEAATHLYFKVL